MAAYKDPNPVVEVTYTDTTDQHFQKVYCDNCKKYSRAIQVCRTDSKTENVSGEVNIILAFLLCLLFILPGVIYIFYKKHQRIPQTSKSSNMIQCCKFCGLPDYITDVKPFNEGKSGL